MLKSIIAGIIHWLTIKTKKGKVGKKYFYTGMLIDTFTPQFFSEINSIFQP